MRIKHNKQTLVEKRKLALKLLDEGRTLHEVAEMVGVTIRSVFRWQEQHDHPLFVRAGSVRSAEHQHTLLPRRWPGQYTPPDRRDRGRQVQL
jgi:hypothetical protein